MEEPRYADINDAELREIEAEFGHPVTRELAQWFIRNRINREAVERMLVAGMQPERHRDAQKRLKKPKSNRVSAAA